MVINAKTKELIIQIGKFVVVGGINTGIDLLVLNLLMYFSGHNEGIYFSLFKGISFIVAVTNSYVMNKFWTFKEKKIERVGSQFSQFLVISIAGFGINVGAASLVVNFVSSPGFISETIWANVGALVGTGVSLVWNFAGYRFIVFKKQEVPTPEDKTA